MIRKTIFWIHLACGVVAGLVILMMSVTGVMLTYERQMLDWADRSTYGAIDVAGERRSIDSLLASLQWQEPEFTPASVVVSHDPVEAVVLVARRGGGSRYLDPYTGVRLSEGATGLRTFFSATRGWHRWFNVNGDARAPWRAITGASNLAFLFLLVSGLYLWLPRVLRLAVFRTRVLFNSKATTGHARDYNWHHVFGIWSVFPLIVVVATATVFSYGWAGDLVEWTFREIPESDPAPGRPAVQSPAHREVAPPSGVAAYELVDGAALADRPPTLDALLGIAAAQIEGWREITLQLPESADDAVSFAIDQGNGGQPQLRHALTLDGRSGELVAWEPFQSQPPSRQARRWVRFLHTGEALGLAGQTLAGIVSFTSIIMVYTGLALAYRRLIVPLFKRRRARS